MPSEDIVFFPNLFLQVGLCEVGVVKQPNELYALTHPRVLCRVHGEKCPTAPKVEGRLREMAAALARPLRRQIFSPEVAWQQAMEMLPQIPFGAAPRLLSMGETVAVVLPERNPDTLTFGGWKIFPLPPEKWRVVEALREQSPEGIERLRVADIFPRRVRAWHPLDPWGPSRAWMAWQDRHARAFETLGSDFFNKQDFGSPAFYFLRAGLFLLNPKDVVVHAPILAGLEVRGEPLGAIVVDLQTREALAVPFSEWDEIPRESSVGGAVAALDLLLEDRPPHYGQFALVPQGAGNALIYLHPRLPGLTPDQKKTLTLVREAAGDVGRFFGVPSWPASLRESTTPPEVFADITQSGWEALNAVARRIVEEEGWPDLQTLGLDLAPEVVGPGTLRALGLEDA